MQDIWKPHTNNDLTRIILELLKNDKNRSNVRSWMSKAPALVERPSLCHTCSELDFWQADLTFKVSVSSLTTTKQCQLCRLIYESLQGHDKPSRGDEVVIQRNGPTLEIQGDIRPILTFYYDPGLVSNLSKQRPMANIRRRLRIV